MLSTNGRKDSEPAAPTAQVEAARRLACAIVGAFETCELSWTPLTELQKIALIEAALLEFDGIGAHLASLGIVERTLREANESASRGHGFRPFRD